MLTDSPVALASITESIEIATMSRDYVEQGLAWTWTPPRVARAIRDRETNVAVVRLPDGLAAFGIMSYHRSHAHLQLLAVRTQFQRTGVGSAVLNWLEQVAEVAGLSEIRAEALRDNPAALAFYRKHGYQRIAFVPRMYDKTLDGVRLNKKLRAGDPSE